MRNKALRSLFVLGLLVIGGLVVARSAQADAIPEPEAVAGDGRNVSPVHVTDVQMISETVLLSVQNLPFPLYYDPERQRLGAVVTVDFLFRNPNLQPESLTVGFPLFLSSNNRGDSYPEILELKAFVNGTEAPAQEEKINGVRWSVWPMSFPPGDTALRVTYHAFAVEPSGGPVASLKYLLYTGAAWAGPIGQADLIVRYPFPIEEAMLAPKRTLAGYQLDQFEVRWRRENFEPTEADDLVITFVKPELWRDVLRARQQLATDSTGENYRVLGEAYRALIYSCDPFEPESTYSFCSQLVQQLARAQFTKATELAPGRTALAPSATVVNAPTPAPIATATVQAPPTPIAQNATEAPPTATALPVPTVLPTTTPAPSAEQSASWGIAIGFISAFVVIVGGILFLRRRPTSTRRV